MFPKEHGAWNALFICLAAGWISLGHFSLTGLALTGLWASAFALRGPWNFFRQYRQADPPRARSALFVLWGLGIVLLVSALEIGWSAPFRVLWLLGWVGVPIGTVLLGLSFWKRNLRFSLAEVLGFLGLALVVPVFYLLDPAHEPSRAQWLGLLWGGYFLLSLAGVKVRQKWLEGFRKKKFLAPADRFSQGWWVLLLYAVWVEVLGDTSGGKLVLMGAPLYAALKTLIGIVWGRPSTPMMRLGLLEMLHSILFTVIWAWSWFS